MTLTDIKEGLQDSLDEAGYQFDVDDAALVVLIEGQMIALAEWEEDGVLLLTLGTGCLPIEAAEIALALSEYAEVVVNTSEMFDAERKDREDNLH
jgi:23S rRNA G2445 N2-methylase RlmL